MKEEKGNFFFLFVQPGKPRQKKVRCPAHLMNTTHARNKIFNEQVANISVIS